MQDGQQTGGAGSHCASERMLSLWKLGGMTCTIEVLQWMSINSSEGQARREGHGLAPYVREYFWLSRD